MSKPTNKSANASAPAAPKAGRRSLVNKLHEPLIIEKEQGKEFEVEFVKTWQPLFEGKPRTVHTVKHNGEFRDLYGSKMLDDCFAQLSGGETVFVTFTGKKKLAGGNTFKEYSVEVAA